MKYLRQWINNTRKQEIWANAQIVGPMYSCANVQSSVRISLTCLVIFETTYQKRILDLLDWAGLEPTYKRSACCDRSDGCLWKEFLQRKNLIVETTTQSWLSQSTAHSLLADKYKKITALNVVPSRWHTSVILFFSDVARTKRQTCPSVTNIANTYVVADERHESGLGRVGLSDKRRESHCGPDGVVLFYTVVIPF